MNIALAAILIFELLLVIAGIYMIWSWMNQTPFYPSSGNKLKELIENKELKLPKEAVFIDIGSGDGRIVATMSEFTKEADGIEFNPFLTLLSKVKLFLTRKKNTKIYHRDFFKHDYKKYNVAYMYIFNQQIDKLQEKLFSEMPKGSIIITNTFKFSKREPDKTIKHIYIYEV